MRRSQVRENIALLARKDLYQSRLEAGKNPEMLYSRGSYKFFSFIRIVSFAVAAFFLLILLISYLFQLSNDGLSESAISGYRLIFNNILLSFSALVFGFMLSCPKSNSTLKTIINTIGVCLAVSAGVWLCVYILSLMKQANNYYDGGLEKYLYRHLIPLAVFTVITVILFFFKLAEHRAIINRYNEVCREAYDRFLETHADGGYADAEWQAYIDNYSREARAFPLKRSLKDKRRKQREVETKED